MNTALDRPSTTSQKYSNDENLSATSASAGAATISTAVPNRPPITENTRPAPSAISAWPFLRHRVGLVGVRGRGRRAGHAQQAAGNVAGEDRHRGGGDDRRHRRHRRHEEGDRHQQRRGHRRGEPGHRADEQAEQRRARRSPTARRGRRPAPTACERMVQVIARSDQYSTGSTPQGSGTRSPCRTRGGSRAWPRAPPAAPRRAHAQRQHQRGRRSACR